MSKPREAHSILENSDMSREKVVAAEEKLLAWNRFKQPYCSINLA
jgi:hypothetical protein